MCFIRRSRRLVLVHVRLGICPSMKGPWTFIDLELVMGVPCGRSWIGKMLGVDGKLGGILISGVCGREFSICPV